MRSGSVKIVCPVVACLAAAACAQSAKPSQSPIEAARRFVAAVRANDAAAARALVGTTADPAASAKAEAWVDALIAGNRTRDDSALAVGRSASVSGTVAAVAGAFDGASFLQCVAQDGQWKILPPGDAKAFGFDAQQVAALSRMATAARRADAKKRTDADRADAEAKPTVATGRTADVAKALATGGKYFSPAAAQWAIEHTDTKFRDGDRIAFLLVRAGDVASATALLPMTDTRASRVAGLIAGSGPTPTPAAATALLDRYADPKTGSTNKDDIAYGLTTGLALKGQYDAAVDAAAKTGIPVYARAVALLYAPDKARVAAFRRDFPPNKLGGQEAKYAARAAVLAKDADYARSILQTAVERGSQTSSYPEELRADLVAAFADVGDTAEAERLTAEIKDSQEQNEAFVRTLLPAARKGDVAAIDAAAAKRKFARSLDGAVALRVYALAKAGRLAEAEPLVLPASPDKKNARVDFPGRLGMIAFAQNEAGQTDAAAKTIQKAVDLIIALPTVDARRRACNGLLGAAILGPDRFAYDAILSDLW